MSSIPYAPSNANSVSAVYRHHENIKRHAYGQQICEVEHVSFTPLVLSAIGGLASEATTFYKRLASLLSAKMNIVWLWDGFAAAFPFLCFAQPSLVSMELDLQWDIFHHSTFIRS